LGWEINAHLFVPARHQGQQLAIHTDTDGAYRRGRPLSLCQQVPQLAALYHNDCLHVANELLTLPVVFAGPLKAVSGGIPPDFIPEVGLYIRFARICWEQTSEPRS